MRIQINSAAKQQISLVVSVWQSPFIFVWPGVPKQGMTTAPSSQSESYLTVFCINEIVSGYVVYLVNVIQVFEFNLYINFKWKKKKYHVLSKSEITIY